MKSRNRKTNQGFGYGAGPAQSFDGSVPGAFQEGGFSPAPIFAPIEILQCPKCSTEFEAELNGELLTCPTCNFTTTT
jgi:hypothetical protein